MSLEEAIKHCNEVADSYDGTVPDCRCASNHRQLASWLQELKERREKELRQIPHDMTEEVCETLIDLTKRIIEILPDLIASVTANMPEAIEQYIESKRGDQK